MKVLHTADWHLGKRLGSHSRIEEQKEVLEEIAQIADKESVHVIILAGDCFDAINPSTEAIELFYKALKKLSKNGQRLVVAIAGNHDSPDRLEAPDPLAKECGILFVGQPMQTVAKLNLDSGISITESMPGFCEISVPDSQTPLRLLLTPYANKQRFNLALKTGDDDKDFNDALSAHWQELVERHCDDVGLNILLTHLFFTKRDSNAIEESDDEKSILHVGGAKEIFSDTLPKGLDYVACGHLHRPHTIEGGPCPIVYAGSPLAYSMSETDQEKQVFIVEKTGSSPIKKTVVALTKGRKCYRLNATSISDAINQLKEHCDHFVELTIQTTTFLTADERKQLTEAHPRLTIIPELVAENNDKKETKHLDLSQSRLDLFKHFFKQREGLDASEELCTLFNEVLAQDSSEDDL